MDQIYIYVINVCMKNKSRDYLRSTRKKINFQKKVMYTTKI